MNQDIFQGKWIQLKGALKSKWGKLTDGDLARLDGNRKYLVGILQERYGWQKDRAEQEIHALEQSINSARAA